VVIYDYWWLLVAIGGYWWLLVTIILMIIDGYYVGSHWWLFCWRPLVVILLEAIGGC